jgi:HEAT repeat protein
MVTEFPRRMIAPVSTFALALAMGLGAVSSGPSAAFAQAKVAPSASRASQAAALWELLQAPHPQVDGQALRRIGPDVRDLLIETATSSRIEAPVRLRALGWLQWYPSTASRAVLMEALRARQASVATMRVALRALAVGFGAESLPTLGEYLVHRDVYVREAAAYALGDIDDPKAAAVLQDRLEREPDLTPRDAIVASLQRHADRTAARKNQR